MFLNTYPAKIFLILFEFVSTGVFRNYATFFLICFYRNPLEFLQETKDFASIEDSLGLSTLCDLPETIL